MIHENTFTNEWIQKISEYYKLGKKRADPALIEKVTKALYLLECLAKTNLKFIFKGGTSLLLLLNEMHRFSIDIDIIIEEHKNKVDMDIIVSEIVEGSAVFTRVEENVRKSNHRVPKAHYKFFYVSSLDGMESYVLLDILFEKNLYADVVKNNIDCKFIKFKKPEVHVNMPSCLLYTSPS